MGTIFVKSRAGVEKELKADPARTVLDAMRDGGIDEVLALCGGTCSCCTCHVIVDPEFIDRLDEMKEMEHGLLDSSEHRTPLSRLACQIVFRDDLDGLRVKVAPED